MPPAIPDKIPCESAQELQQEVSVLRETLSLEETEETWDRIARALARFGAIVKGGGFKFEKELVHGVKAAARPIVSAMNSERTRLSAAALECITIIAPRIGPAFDTLVPLFMPHILRLSTRSNKVYVTRSQASMGLIIGYCHIPSIIPYLLIACKESKIVTGRAVAIEGVLRCLNKWDWAQKDIRSRVGDIEEVIKVTGRDKDAGIRQASRKVFEAYKILFPERVDEFTGPLTPVMRKYLDIKPQLHTQKRVDRDPHPVAEKPRRQPTRPDLTSSTSSVPSATTTEPRSALGAHVRSASSNAVVERSATSTGSSHPSKARSMLPPAIIPSRTQSTSRSQSQSRTDHRRQEQPERPRVLSAASTHSVKSAPSNSHPEYEHRPPVRLASSQSNSETPKPVVGASSGQARRVPIAAAVEPHPANRPHPSALTHKAPARLAHPPSENTPRVARPNKGPGRAPLDVTQGAPASTTGFAFPTMEQPSVAPVERKGPQRVPKPAIPIPTPTPAQAVPPKVEKPAPVNGGTPKREVKTSIFRRGAHGPDHKEDGKTKEGFVPRRGGGLTQPTLSQLSKQKPPPGVCGPSVPPGRRGVDAPGASVRPTWGASTKTAPTRGLPVPRGRARGGITRGGAARQVGKTKAKPAMVPLPASPGRQRDVVPQLVPLPESPKPTCADVERRDDEPLAGDVAEVNVPGQNVENETEAAPEAPEPQRPVEPVPAENIEELSEVRTTPAPHTPPFPSVDGSSEEDELEAIKFTGHAYGPQGGLIKTPHKVGSVGKDEALPERNPLGEVVLNG